MTHEAERLTAARERRAHWKLWGPYLSERAWGTVREDYSALGQAWDYFPFDQARSKAYRWNEDGLAGVCDLHQRVCLAIALWNERDPFLKERLYGVTGSEGNHGEDVKEYYFYLDSTPTHSAMRFAYKYPQGAFPYEQLVAENRARDKRAPEFELLETDAFAENRYFDVEVTYAKAGPEDLVARIAVVNRGPEPATLHLLPTVWFRNTWSWDAAAERPRLKAAEGGVTIHHPELGERHLRFEQVGPTESGGAPELLFTENETNEVRVYGKAENPTRFVKDGINDCVVNGDRGAVNAAGEGTKAAAHYVLTLAPGERAEVRWRFSPERVPADGFVQACDAVVDDRQREADAFYEDVIPKALDADARAVMRQALGGMLWSKQYYHYVVKDWLDGDPAYPPPPEGRRAGRNKDWQHLHNADVISMPDKWEYPWYAAWDLAFHCVPLGLVDLDFAKEQLILMLREWYMHPNGQIPAYEWNFSDVNPPVHAWGAWSLYQLEKARTGQGDRAFLERVFHKLLLNFTWWINRKDDEGNNLFGGGFLGLDNIGVFDRSQPLPTGGYMEQADGTSWVAMYALNMLRIALELAQENPAYEDVASKFFEHFVAIDHAINNLGAGGERLWDEQDGFYYDVIHLPGGQSMPLKVRSMVGLTPLFAVETLDPALIERLPGFKQRMAWYLQHRQDMLAYSAGLKQPGEGDRLMLSVVDPDQLRRMLAVMLDEREFLSPYGLRSLSKAHEAAPFTLNLGRHHYQVAYDPADSTSGLFGGNSNWRGPIWFPVNFLLIESLRKFHAYMGDGFKVECPTGSGVWMTLLEVADELSRRLTRIFMPDGEGRRPVYGAYDRFNTDPHWQSHVLFYEFFHGDTGAGLGASHQTGWTGLVATLLAQLGQTEVLEGRVPGAARPVGHEVP
jgi:hypothetical protein